MRRCGGHLVVFARAPRRGAVKRRLAAGIGDAAALRFYRDHLARLLRSLAPDRRWQCWLALTPLRQLLGMRVARASSLRRLAQGRGDLGRRMARPFTILPPGPVVLVGSDIPELRADHVARAFRLLGAADFVFGPAADGGYWLIGAHRRPLPRGFFAGVRWSTRHALADTLANLPRGARIGFADTLEDVDDAAAFRRWQRRVSRPSDAP
jgi:rSAM/selenodomain-associated transferase 1